MCDFCGRKGSEAFVQPARVEKYVPPSAWHCYSCKALYDGLEARWICRERLGNRPLLELDGGTKRTVQPPPDPYPSVHAAISEIQWGLLPVDPIAARVAAVKLSVIMYQSVGRDGRWQTEESFLIGSEHAVHRYTYWST